MSYNTTCWSNCPEGYVNDDSYSLCIDCRASNSCVSLNLEMFKAKGGIIYVNLNFSHTIDFTTFPYQQFQ